MRPRSIVIAFLSLLFADAASAHRLDEYLQATLISIQKGDVGISLRLIPGIAVSSTVIASMDSNGDGVLSKPEQLAYAERTIDDLSLSVDGRPLKLKLVSAEFPPIEQMRNGVGEIHIECIAKLPTGGASRQLILESHNRGPKAVYLVNALVPSGHAISIVAQRRNQTQSFYELDYVQSVAPNGPGLFSWVRAAKDELASLAVSNLFHLGVRHIAEGTDHLLFLLVLLLPAPLIVVGSRWGGIAGVRGSLLHILRIVTAFTVGHSITLTLAAFGLVHVPERPIEVLIAFSILVSAIHAIRPVFPGKEAGIAAFFGLIHGLAFASTLSDLGLGGWARLAGVLSFNLGIEAMQMVVVIATLPSLILLSRTRAYPFLRISGAIFAIIASLGWIVERVAGLQSVMDVAVNRFASHAVWIGATSFLISLVCWTLHAIKPARITSSFAETEPAATSIAQP